MEKQLSVKIDEDVLQLVKEHVKKTRQTISGFITIAAREKVERETTDEIIKDNP